MFLFFFFFACHFTINTLFFTENTMHKIYLDSGLFNLNYQIPQIVYSSLLSGIISALIKYLSLTSKTVVEIKEMKHNKEINLNHEIIGSIKIRFYLFFIITFILLVAFWYYISCFCGVYENTQSHLIKDSLISFGLSLVYPFLLNLIPGIFRKFALNNRKDKKEFLYKISKFIEYI